VIEVMKMVMMMEAGQERQLGRSERDGERTYDRGGSELR
jgi:hypothetical protein